MRFTSLSGERGNVLLCVLCTILVVSIIGGNVLFNCMTRYNVASSQVRSWKESLDAAETGGDIAYAEVRKTILDPTHAFTGTSGKGSGWTYSGGVRSEEHTSELQSLRHLVCRLLLEKKKQKKSIK